MSGNPAVRVAEVGTVVRAAVDSVTAAATSAELRALDPELLGKRSKLSQLKATLGSLPPDERAALGAAINQARTTIQVTLDIRKSDIEKVERRARLESERLDLTEVVEPPRRGHLHLVAQATEALEDVFVGMGFTVAEGPEVETDWYNFEALNMPVSHPARGMWDTFYLDFGEEESTVLRTHTSPVQIRVMESEPPPIYSVMPGRCYRRDTPDASHLASFHQIEGLVVDRGITFGDLAGTIEAFTDAYFGGGIHSRLRPSYFPFTEPSAEFDITCVFCRGEGCRTCRRTGWVELGGCGMVHPNVFAAVGYDPEEWTGFAFGFGIDRLAASHRGIDDLRELVTNDVRLLSQF